MTVAKTCPRLITVWGLTEIGKDWQGPPKIVSDWSYDFGRLTEIGIDYHRPPEIVSDWSYDLNRFAGDFGILSSLS